LLVLAACGGDDGSDGGSDGGGDADALAAVEIERVGDYTHVNADLDYPNPAPSGGDHWFAPNWVNCGVYEGEIPDEFAVHSLEHGAVWIALGPGSTDADREAATALAGEQPSRIFVSDVPDLPSPVELVAWGVRLRLESADDPAAADFVDEYVDAGSAPEAGLTCSDSPVGGTPPVPPQLPL
jgi:hypothetical protein